VCHAQSSNVGYVELCRVMSFCATSLGERTRIRWFPNDKSIYVQIVFFIFIHLFVPHNQRTWWRLFQKLVVRIKLDSTFSLLSLGRYLWWWTIFVSDAIIHPVISVSALALFIWHIYYLISQFLNNVIIIRTKVLFPQAMVTLVDLGRPV
jgi:hypothetical protein